MKKISQRMIVSAGVVPVREADGEYLFLMLRRDNYWEFPKGKQEGGEKLFETAVRETCEETTLTPEDLKFVWGKISKETDRYKKGKKYVVYYIANADVEEIGLPVNPELGHPEHHEYKWLNYEDAAVLANDRVRKILNWANNIVNDETVHNK